MVRSIARRVALGAVVAIAAAAAVAPAASASITPSLTLDQSGGTAAGSTVNLGMDLKFAPSGGDSPAVGRNTHFTGVPNTFSLLGVLGTQISVDELNSTLSGVRMPTSCPATPASVSLTADSYAAPTTPRAASGPLHVTACSKLP